MKDHLRALVQAAAVPPRGLVREYLQVRILASLQRAGAMVPLALLGGTALRLLYALPRYSEDLDFSLERDPALYDFRRFVEAARADLAAEGYAVEARVSDARTVHAAFLRFPGLLRDLDLSPHAAEKVAIKLEIDTRPPASAALETTVVRRHVVLHLQHHDRASLLAGKLHALLARPYLKGRDVYDLFWYLSDPEWPPPNLVLLANALAQTGGKGPPPRAATWRAAARRRIAAADWKRVLADVDPFLEPAANRAAFTRDNLLALLRPRRS